MSSWDRPTRLVPLVARLVEVIGVGGNPGGGRFRYGSGVVVRGRTVLTAAHVVAGAEKVLVRDPAKRLLPASVDPRFVGDTEGPGPDLALVEIEDTALDLPALGLARIDRDSATGEPVKDCKAVGYPSFAEIRSADAREPAVRDTVDAVGVVPVLSKLVPGLLSVLVKNQPLPSEQTRLGESEWKGMSGAPVLAGGLLLGVVSEQAPREGPSSLTAVPLTALEPVDAGSGSGVPDPAAWWSRLGVAGVEELAWLPARSERPRPAYWATLAEDWRALHERMPRLLGRERELAEIAEFATSSSGYRWLVGGAYAGKSALLLETVTSGLPVEAEARIDVVSYFLSRRASDADSTRFLEVIVTQLAYLCAVDAPAVASRDAFSALWQQAVERARQQDRHLLLVVDGLDEDLRPFGLPSVAMHLPTLVGERAHVLIASRPLPELPLDVASGHPLRTLTPIELDRFEGADELLELAEQEIEALLRDDDRALAAEVLGLLAAAGGALSVDDLAQLTRAADESMAAQAFQIGGFVDERVGRSLEPVSSGEHPRYRFAHENLLERASRHRYLAHPEFGQRINRWAEEWRERGWPSTGDAATTTPRYLLDTYPAALGGEPDRLAALVSDAGWIEAAIRAVGVARALADLGRAQAAAPSDKDVAAMLAAVRAQARNLIPKRPLFQPGYIPRQLWLHAASLADDRLADRLRTRMGADRNPTLIPLHTTRRVSRLLVGELGRHRSAVSAVAVLADGRVVSCGKGDRPVLLWDPADPDAEPRELGRQDWVDKLAVLADGRVVGHDGHAGQMLVWDPAGAKPLILGRNWNTVTALAGLADGRCVSAQIDTRVLLWDPAEPGAEPLELWRGQGIVWALAVLSDGRLLCGVDDGRILLWNPAEPGAEPLEFGRQEGSIKALAVLADGRIVSAERGERGRILLWDPAGPAAEPLELGRHEASIEALAVLSDGRIVSTEQGEGGRILLWDPADPRAEPLEIGRRGWGLELVGLPGDGHLVSGDDDGRILLWDLREPGAERLQLGGRERQVWGLAMLEDGRVVSAEGDQGRMLLWNPARPDVEPIELGVHEDWVWALVVLSDGRVVSAGRNEGRILLWDPADPGARPLELGHHEPGVVELAAMADGRVVSVGGDEGRMLLWDSAERGAAPLVLGQHAGTVRALAVLSDGRIVSGERGNSGRILLWDPAESDAERLELGRHDGPVWALAALTDGRLVSAGGDDARLLLWNPAAPGAEPLKLGGHLGPVNALAVPTDGQVVSCGRDELRVWDVTTEGATAEIRCSATTLAARPTDHARPASLVIAHSGAGLSFWYGLSRS